MITKLQEKKNSKQLYQPPGYEIGDHLTPKKRRKKDNDSENGNDSENENDSDSENAVVSNDDDTDSASDSNSDSDCVSDVDMKNNFEQYPLF